MLLDGLQEPGGYGRVVLGAVEQGFHISLDQGERVRSSWLTLATNSFRTLSSCLMRVRSWNTRMVPACVFFGVVNAGGIDLDDASVGSGKVKLKSVTRPSAAARVATSCSS